MRYLVFLILYACLSSVGAVEWEDRRLFKGVGATQTLRVLSSTDTSVFAPIVEKYLMFNPNIDIEYLVAGSADIYEEFRQRADQYDLVISSAMDLQLKLVNDGYAYRVDDFPHPGWAQWRHSLFGFTLEPASIVVNRKAFAELQIPQSRADMIAVLRANPDLFRDRIGTYDVRQSGLGYLFATQDARASETYWRLMEIMGSLNTRLYCCSGDMIEDLANGKIFIAYNVLGSYADARHDVANIIDVIAPTDYRNIMMRTALIARSTPRASAAIDFLGYLTSSRWSDTEEGPSSVPSLNGAPAKAQDSIIALEPGLMIFLDRLKRQTFINEWESAIIQ